MYFNNKKINVENVVYYAITLCAIVVRFLWIYLVPNNPVSDFLTYQKIATNIFQGHGVTYLGSATAFQSMGYTILLGYFYKLVGNNSIMYGKLLNVIISSITLPIMYLIIKKIFTNKKLRIITYIIIVFFPNYIAYTNVLASETLMVLIFSIIILIQITMKDSAKWYVLLGIFIGIETLIKPYFLVYPILASAALYISKRNIKQSAKCLLISAVASIMVISPWTYRNYKDFRRVIPVSYNSGYVLFINNNDDNTNGAWMPIRNIKISDKVEKELQEKGLKYGVPQDEELESVIHNPDLEPIFKREATKWILNNKRAFIALGIKRVLNTFFSGGYDINNWCYNTDNKTSIIKFFNNNYPLNLILKNGINLLSSIALIFSLYSFLIKKNKNYVEGVLSINVLFFFLIQFIYEGQPRYCYPLLFIFILILMIIINNIHQFKRTNM